MIPYSQISVGDSFSDPSQRSLGGITWVVLEKNKEEKMIKIQAASSRTGDLIRGPIWKRNTDEIFSESWREYRVP